jgi:hypothetical protein
MPSLLLACGPYFDETGAAGSLALFLLIKPLAYFAFIQAFRYRVNRPLPMRFSQAIALTAARVGLSIVLVGAWIAVLAAIGSGPGHAIDGALLVSSWIFLYAERLFSWWLVGARGARLSRRRLICWIISGTLIGTAFDIAMVWGLIEGAVPQIFIVLVIAAFIAALHVVGRRDSVRRRFIASRFCAACTYDLTGNLSGRCPECGHAIGTSSIRTT